MFTLFGYQIGIDEIAKVGAIAAIAFFACGVFVSEMGTLFMKVTTLGVPDCIRLWFACGAPPNAEESSIVESFDEDNRLNMHMDLTLKIGNDL